jgi:hypothetical protein
VQKKGVKYVLIALVVLIWGLVVYRIVQGLDQGGAVPVTVAHEAPAAPVTKVDTFSLVLNYPDPFLDQVDSVVEDPVEKRTNVPPTPFPAGGYGPPPAPAFNPSDVKYIGFIGNAQRKTAMINYRGTETMVKERDRVGDITILRIASGFLVLTVKGTPYTIPIEH